MPAAKTKGRKRPRSATLDTEDASSSKRVKSDSMDSPSSSKSNTTIGPCLWRHQTQSTACSDQGLVLQMQEKFCLATAYKDAKLSRCTSCSRRNGMDTCRFRDIRFIIRDASGACCGIGFKSKPVGTSGRVVFPELWNSDLRKEHVHIIKVGVIFMPSSPHC
jgi:hypothetical protein